MHIQVQAPASVIDLPDGYPAYIAKRRLAGEPGNSAGGRGKDLLRAQQKSGRPAAGSDTIRADNEAAEHLAKLEEEIFRIEEMMKALDAGLADPELYLSPEKVKEKAIARRDHFGKSVEVVRDHGGSRHDKDTAWKGIGGGRAA